MMLGCWDARILDINASKAQAMGAMGTQPPSSNDRGARIGNFHPF